jgi:hypothetical protein
MKRKFKFIEPAERPLHVTLEIKVMCWDRHINAAVSIVSGIILIVHTLIIKRLECQIRVLYVWNVQGNIQLDPSEFYFLSIFIRGRDCMVVGFTTAYAISGNQH